MSPSTELLSLRPAAAALETRSVASLVPYARNARVHDDAHVAQIAASIREWGWTIPVLIDELDGIIAGHGRVLAARKLGYVNVPVLVARGWSDAKKRAYVLADNKLALNAQWDNTLLAGELSELRDAYALDLIGFTDDEFQKLMRGVSAPEEFREYDGNMATEHECPKCGYRF
jgi:ParB-like chromosome segregation protein Spo0J